MNNLFEKPFTWDNQKHFLYQLPHRAQVQFGLFCANQIKHLMKDERSLKALEVTQAFLDGKATQQDCRDAANAAYAAYAAAAYAAAAAVAAVAAADAAYAVAAAVAAANAAVAAANAAYAAYAAATRESFKQEQMNFLRELILENLSQEDRECWLLIASF